MKALVRRYEELKTLLRARGHVETDEERIERHASFAFGNLALMSKYRNATPAELAALKELCRRTAFDLSMTGRTCGRAPNPHAKCCAECPNR